MIYRILASFLLLFSVLFMPFWVSVILALAGMIYFSRFFEAPVLFLLSDSLFGAKEARFNGMVFISFIIVAIVLIIIEIVKKKTRLS